MTMKHFIAALFCVSLLGLSVTAQAAPVSRDQANKYFASCTASAKAPGEAMRDLCACTAARVATMLTAEELAVMPEKTPEGQAAMKKMLVNVYAPCTEVVAAEMFDYECVSNKQLYDLDNDFDTPAVCSCAAQKTAAWYAGKAGTFMEDALKKDSTAAIANPLGAILAHAQVKSQNLNNLVGCSAEPVEPQEPAAQSPAGHEPATQP